MRRIEAALIAATLGAAGSPAALAAISAINPARAYPDPRYLARTELDPSGGLAAPPKPGSPEAAADFGELLRYQATRTPEECARAARVVNVTLGTLFGPGDGPLSEAEADRWAAFFERIRIDTDYFVQQSKLRWKRPRPYQADPRIEPCVHRETTAAYPSGHAAISLVFAEILSRLDPSRAEAFRARAARIAEDRVLAGVHHPADIEAGKKLGRIVLAKLLAKRRFRAELSQALSLRGDSDRSGEDRHRAFEALGQ